MSPNNAAHTPGKWDGLTIYNCERAIDSLKRRGFLRRDEYGDLVITDSGRAAIEGVR